MQNAMQPGMSGDHAEWNRKERNDRVISTCAEKGDDKTSFLTTFTHEKTRGTSGTVTSYLQQMWRTRCRTAARTRTKPEELSG